MTIKRAKVPKLLGAASHVSSPRTFIFVAVVHVQFFFQKKKKKDPQMVPCKRLLTNQ